MKLGRSLERGRRRSRGGGSKKSAPERTPEEVRALWAGRLLPAAMIVGGLAIGYLVATLILFPAPSPEGGLLSAPSLVGMAQADAERSVTDAGLMVERIDSMHHPEVPAGTVIGQSPLAGQMVRDGGSMRIATSLGPETRPIPDVLALRAEGARTVLEASGFTVAVDSAEATVPRGRVVAVDPEPGTVLELPTEVRVTVSLGPPMIALPDLRGMTEEAATDTLRALGIGVSEVDTRFQFGRNQGIVLDQDPAPETMVEQGGEIRLVVGRRGRGEG